MRTRTAVGGVGFHVKGCNGLGKQRRQCLRLAAVQVLEPRVLFAAGPTDVLVNAESYDTSGDFSQANTSTLVYTPVGLTQPVVNVAYTDTAAQIAGNGKHDGDISMSTDGGATFTTPNPALPDSPFGDGGNLTLARDDRTGTIYATSLADTAAPQHVVPLFRSTNNGASFTYVTTVTPQVDSEWNSTTGIFDKPYLAIDNYPNADSSYYRFFAAYIHVTSASEDLFITRTKDPTSWPTATDAHNLPVDGTPGTQLVTGSDDPNIDIVEAPQIVVGPNHTVFMTWLQMAHDPNTSQETVSLHFAYSTDYAFKANTGVGDWTFPSPIVLSTLNGDTDNNVVLNAIHQAGFYPSIAVNPVNNDLYVAYADGDPTQTGSEGEAGSGLDVYVTRLAWNNGAPAFDAPAQIVSTNADGTPALEDQWQPTIAVAPTGSEVFVGYYDRRNDPTNTNIDAYASLASINLSGGALNGKLTWNFNNTRLTQSSFAPPSTDTRSISFGYLGDRDGATADYSSFYYTFTETHPTDFNGTTKQNSDIHLSKIPIAYPSPAPQMPIGLSAIKAANTSSPATLYWTGAYAPADVVHVQYASGTQWLDYPLTASAASHTLQLLPAYLNTAATTWYRIRVDNNGGITSSDFAYTLAGPTPEYPAITANSYNSGTSQETINWNGAAYAATDVMHIQYSPDGGATWNDVSFSATGGAGIISGISSGTSLFVQIQVQHSSGVWSLPGDGLILAGGGPDLINLSRAAANLLVTVNGVTVYTAAQSLIHGLAVAGNSASDTFTVDESGGAIILTDGISFDGKAGANTLAITGTSAADTLSVTATAATFNASTITFQNAAGVVYTDGNGNDIVSVAGAIALTLNMGQGNDILNVAANANAIVNLGASNGDLTINGNGNTSLIFGTGNPNLAFQSSGSVPTSGSENGGPSASGTGFSPAPTRAACNPPLRRGLQPVPVVAPIFKPSLPIAPPRPKSVNAPVHKIVKLLPKTIKKLLK